MKTVLVDTSVWIDAFNGKTNWQTELLRYLIDSNSRIVLCPIIVQEILQGIRQDAEFVHVKYVLSGFELLHVDPLEAAYGAADLYRAVRKKGVTIRKSNDCLIAYYAIASKVFLLHNDVDFSKIVQHTSLAEITEFGGA